MLKIKEYKKVKSLEEAWELNQKRSSRLIGGMMWLKMSRGSCATAIDLSGLGLDQIREDPSQFEIGCMVPLRAIEQHQGLIAYTDGAIKEALRHIVGVQFRNTATVGGSIFGKYGFSDVLTMFLAMDTFVELYRSGIVPLSEFVKNDYGRDVLVRIYVKKQPARFFYQSVRNTQTDFPVLTCAAAFLPGQPFMTVFGARPGRAVRLLDHNAILGEQITEETAREFAEFAAERIRTGSNMRGSKEYRTHLVIVLAKRAALFFADGRGIS